MVRTLYELTRLLGDRIYHYYLNQTNNNFVAVEQLVTEKTPLIKNQIKKKEKEVESVSVKIEFEKSKLVTAYTPEVLPTFAERYSKIASLVATAIWTNFVWQARNSYGYGVMMPGEEPSLSWILSIGGDWAILNTILLAPMFDHVFATYLKAVRENNLITLHDLSIKRDFKNRIRLQLGYHTFLALVLSLKYYAGAVGWSFAAALTRELANNKNWWSILIQSVATGLGNGLFIQTVGDLLADCEASIFNNGYSKSQSILMKDYQLSCTQQKMTVNHNVWTRYVFCQENIYRGKKSAIAIKEKRFIRTEREESWHTNFLKAIPGVGNILFYFENDRRLFWAGFFEGLVWTADSSLISIYNLPRILGALGLGVKTWLAFSLGYAWQREHPKLPAGFKIKSAAPDYFIVYMPDQDPFTPTSMLDNKEEYQLALDSVIKGQKYSFKKSSWSAPTIDNALLFRHAVVPLERVPILAKRRAPERDMNFHYTMLYLSFQKMKMLLKLEIKLSDKKNRKLKRTNSLSSDMFSALMEQDQRTAVRKLKRTRSLPVLPLPETENAVESKALHIGKEALSVVLSTSRFCFLLLPKTVLFDLPRVIITFLFHLLKNEINPWKKFATHDFYRLMSCIPIYYFAFIFFGEFIYEQLSPGILSVGLSQEQQSLKYIVPSITLIYINLSSVVFLHSLFHKFGKQAEQSQIFHSIHSSPASFSSCTNDAVRFLLLIKNILASALFFGLVSALLSAWGGFCSGENDAVAATSAGFLGGAIASGSIFTLLSPAIWNDMKKEEENYATQHNLTI